MMVNLSNLLVVRNRAEGNGETTISPVAEAEVVVVIMITIRVDKVEAAGATTRTMDSRPECMALRTTTMKTIGSGHPQPKNKKMLD